MNKKVSLEAMKAMFNEDDKKTFDSIYYRFWEMGEDSSVVIRFLPDLNENNPRGFLVEKTFHSLTVNGKKKTVPCLSMYDEECPICKASRDFYKAKEEANGKKYWRKKQYLAQAIVVRDPLPPVKQSDGTMETFEGKVAIFPIGYQAYNVIKSAFASDIEPLECLPFDFKNGYDFVLKKSGQGKYVSYHTGTKFIMKQRALTEDELTAAMEGMVDLKELLPANPGIEKVTALLNADMTGEAYSDDDGEPFVPPTIKEEVKEVSANLDAGVEDMLAAIRARRAVMKAA